MFRIMLSKKGAWCNPCCLLREISKKPFSRTSEIYSKWMCCLTPESALKFSDVEGHGMRIKKESCGRQVV